MGSANTVYLGSSYYLPHHDPEDWERDFARMAAAGHNALRTGELLASWDFLEREPRKPDFTSLDRAFELAARHGLQILLGTGSCCPPAWLLEQHPDLPIVDRDGIPYPLGAMWSWACINHPAFVEESERYLHQLLERYGVNPVLLGWQVHNEPGYPFVPREDRVMPAWFDYNPHTVAAFRTWLADRYADIEALNEAWRWVPTNMRQRDFASVAAPRATPAEWGCPNAWLDWRRFTRANWSLLIRRQHDLIKEASPATVTMTNVYGAAMDLTGRLGIDSWDMARQGDAIGFSLYPGQHMPAAAATGSPSPGDPDYPAWFLDYAWSSARHAGRPLWLPELESGPLAGWAAGPHHATTAADVRRWGLQALARGAKMILFQGYREWPCLPLHWGALADWEGEPTPRLEAAAQLARLVTEQADVVGTALPVPAKVALLHTIDNTVFNAGCGNGDLVGRSLHGMHGILARQGYAVEFIAPEYLTSEHGYQVIILPCQALVSQATAQALADFVAAGGNLVSLPLTAMVDERCWVWPRRPGGGLAEVLGVRETALHVEDVIWVRDGAGSELAGHHHRQELELADGVEVLASFANGDPAVTRNRHGQGQAVHLATHLDMAGAAAPGVLSFWRELLAGFAVVPEVELPDPGLHLDCKLSRATSGGHLLYCANSTATPVDLTLGLPRVQAATARSLWPVGAINHMGKHAAGGVAIRVELPAWEALVARLD